MKEWRKNRKLWMSGAIMTVALFAALIVATGANGQIQVGTQTGLSILSYSVKYDCHEHPDDPAFADDYGVDTKINVHNPNALGAEINTKLLELDNPMATNPEMHQFPMIVQPSQFAPDWGFNIDCSEILSVETECLAAMGFPPPVTPLEGFVVIETLLPLDVLVLYKMDGEGMPGVGQGVDLEYERVLPTARPGFFTPPTFKAFGVPDCDWEFL